MTSKKRKKKKKSRYKGLIIALLITALSATSVYIGGELLLKALYPLGYDEFVEVYAEMNNLDESFVYAVIECESGFDPEAVSSTGAVGLMQIMPETFHWIGTKTQGTTDFSLATDPETNIAYGCWFYGYLMKKYHDEATAVAAYHAGMGNADKWLGDSRYSHDGETLYDIPFPSTKAYVERVMKTKNIYSKLYDRKES